MSTNPWDPTLDFLDPVEDWAPSRFQYQPDYPAPKPSPGKSIFKPWVRELPGQIGRGLGYAGTGLEAALRGQDPTVEMARRYGMEAGPSPNDDEEKRAALEQFATGYDPFREMTAGEGVRLPSGYKPPTSMEPEIPDGYRGITDAGRTAVPTTSGGGKVDVTIDGKTYSYGGGQRGGENGPAPVQDARLNFDESSHSGVSSGGFGGELRRMGRGPLEIASTGGAGELGAETGASGMVKLSPDSTTPMALELKEQERKRYLDDILYANRLKKEQELSKDPLYVERELAKIKAAEQSSVATDTARANTMALERAYKRQDIQRVEQSAREAMLRMEEKYASDPQALEKVQREIERGMMAEKQAIESRYGAT